MLSFHLDEHIHPAIAAGLRRRGIDVTTTIIIPVWCSRNTPVLQIGHVRPIALFAERTFSEPHLGHCFTSAPRSMSNFSAQSKHMQWSA